MPATVKPTFDFERFVATVFAPESGETVLVLTDDPTSNLPLNPDWAARHEMAERWRAGLEAIGDKEGFRVLPLLRFAATGQSNGVFPPTGKSEDREVDLFETLARATLAISMTEYSMTGALAIESIRRPGARQFRAASMPLARADMEDTCLNVDYAALRGKCAAIHATIDGSVGAEVRFSTGDTCYFDLRHRQAFVDDGYLRRDKEGIPLINLPSGEVWIVPYEGEVAGDASHTQGVIPIPGSDGSVARFVIEANRIVSVEGENGAREEFEALLDVDPARRNVGELAFGCNDGARVSGLFIEDEKAGLHWGLGRSEFLGGTVGVEAFRDESTVLHVDTPYAPGCRVTVAEAAVIDADGGRRPVLENGRYAVG